MSPLIKRITQLLILVVIQAALLFLSAGSLKWTPGWWYIGLYVLMLFLASFIMIPKRPEVIAERSSGTSGGRRWDLRVTRLMSIPTLGLLVLAGFDHRWNWTAPLPLWLRIAGATAFIFGYIIVLWAMFCNPYFSQVVRIQKERGHVAVTGGPYRLVRHPGYLGMTSSMLGSVFILDSILGLICFALYLALILYRTSMEDRTLRNELEGYAEYAAKTRYRLIPGVW